MSSDRVVRGACAGLSALIFLGIFTQVSRGGDGGSFTSATKSPVVLSVRFAIPPAAKDLAVFRVVARDKDQVIVALDIDFGDGVARHQDFSCLGSNKRLRTLGERAILKLRHKYKQAGSYLVTVVATSSDCGRHPHIAPQVGKPLGNSLKVFPSEVTVPKIVGRHPSSAECLLQETGLRWRDASGPIKSWRPGCPLRSQPVSDPHITILKQSPRPKARVRPGTIVVYDTCLAPADSGCV